MDDLLNDQTKFWVSTLTAVSTKSGTSITELKKMDVFEFFALLSVIEESKTK